MGLEKRISRRTLIGLSFIAVALFVLSQNSNELVRQPWYTEKLKASRLALVAANAIKTRAVELGLVIDAVNDQNMTGLIGQEYTDITTDRGLLEAKLTTTNPNIAAAVVDMLKTAELSKGDLVAIGLTGSMPAMNIAALAAIEALELKPIIIASVGSSTWGATNPDFNWLDMESYLFEKRIFHYRSIAASIGGGRDNGRGLSALGRELIEKSILRSGMTYIRENSLEESIHKRMMLYNQFAKSRPIKAYINVGGGLSSLGAAINGRLIPSGLSENLGMKNFPVKGVIVQMAERGIPIIHLLNVNRIADAYGLPIAPQPLPEIGEGKVFIEDRHNVMIALLCFFILIGCITVFVRLDLFHRLFLKRVTPASHQALCFVFLLLGMTSFASAKNLVWEELPLKKYHERIEVGIHDVQTNYYAISQEEPVELKVKGPRKFLVLIRNAFQTGEESPKEFRLNVLMDGRNFDEYAFKASPSAYANVVGASSGYRLGQLQKFMIEIPGGVHVLKFFPADSMNQQKLFLRFFVSEATAKGEKRISMSPDQYEAVVNLIYKEKEQTYYRMTHEKPVQLSVVGPTELKVVTRLEFNKRMKGKYSYQVQIVEDGNIIQKRQYRSYKSDVSAYKKVTSLTPGRSRSFLILVPKGRHEYRLIPVTLQKQTVIVKILIPQKDVGIVEK